MKKNILMIALFGVILASCSSNDKKKPENPDVAYKEAQQAYDKKDYDKASELFKELEKEFPYSRYTKDGLLKAAYAQFQEAKYDESAQTAKRYLELYPGAKDSDYALHLVAMSYYNRIDDPRRDQAVTLDAKKYLQDLVGRYPESEHAIDAKIKLDFVNDQLATKEMQIGRFYLEQNQVPASINRFKTVVKQYQTTSHIKEALYRMVEGYLVLGLIGEAHNAALLLGKNYPESAWYKKAFALLKEHDPNFTVE